MMLSVDALGMLGEFQNAARLLDHVTANELAAEGAPAVLGDAALRANAYRHALTMTASAEQTEAVQRIRADAHLNLGWTNEEQDALATLDRLVEEGGPEADQAGQARLAAAVDRTTIAWSEEAASLLRERGWERPVTVAEAFYLGRTRQWDKGAELLRRHEGESWAAIAELRLAWMRRQGTWLIGAALRVLTFGPSQQVRLECGRALYFGGERERAKEVLLGIARDGSATSLVRANAYSLLVRLFGDDEDEWEMAYSLHKEWVEVRATDVRASAWAPRVANRRRVSRERAAAKTSS